MGFHKRYIDNEKVISLFKDGGVDNVIRWYTGKADALILETGLASKINDILLDVDWQTFGTVRRNDHIEKLILDEMGYTETRT
jgi:hypothetical protein|tara:strand:+ start:697 stop:945 length:249 start_codon:yes stop_codon:yes gene_type:complete